jgi:hypothetical protein
MDRMDSPRTIGAFAYRRVRVTCVWCPRRRGDYDTDRMIARLGPAATWEEVLLFVTRTCPRPKAWLKRGPSQYVPWCRAVLDDVAYGRPPDRIP